MSLNYYVVLLFACFSSVFSLEENPHIVIIGAGASGLAAATKLWKSNFTNITILEAEDRIGGRILSVEFGDANVDLGAQWCYGQENNTVYDLVKQYDILKTKVLNERIIYSNGTYFDQDVVENLLAFWTYEKTSKDGLGVEAGCKYYYPMCLRAALRSAYGPKYRHAPNKLKMTLDAFNWMQNRLSYVDYPVANLMNWNGLGFKTVLDVMLQKYPDPSKALPIENKILLNKEVVKIVWKIARNPKIRVKCSDNTEYTADHVIFTPSLAVLKASWKKMFEPQLSTEKVNVINEIQTDAVMKVALHFPTTWWKTTEVYNLVWTKEDYSNIFLSPVNNRTVVSEKLWMTTSIFFTTAENNPKVLIGLFSGEMINELEAESDQMLLDGCMYMFRKFFGEKYTVVNADKIVRSKWMSNPHFGMTLAALPTEYDSTTYPDILALPLKQGNGNPAVLFAGEATQPHYHFTVHGAIETGYREAERIIQLYGREAS